MKRQTKNITALALAACLAPLTALAEYPENQLSSLFHGLQEIWKTF